MPTRGSTGSNGRTRAAATAAAGAPDLLPILTAIGEAAYEWTLDDDVLRWSANAAALIGVDDLARIGSGRRYAALLDRQSTTSRFDAITGTGACDHGDGVGYRVRYRLVSPDGTAADCGWFEDTGIWYAGRNGKPARARGVIRAVDTPHAEQQKLEYLSQHDSLTGQLNRVQLLERLQAAIDETRTAGSCALLIAAIDNLALINDMYGFEFVDHVIARVGRRLAKRLRGGDSIGRLSGNKFGLVLRNCTGDDMAVAAKRLLAAVHDRAVITDLGPVSVTISIGGVIAPENATTVDQAVGCAHEALDQSRRNRRNTFTIYRPNVARDNLRRRNIHIADAIVRGLNEHKFHFAYQPIVAAATGEVAYHECLLRLDKPGGGESGGALVVVAERLGLIRLIDHRVLDLVFDILDSYPQARLSVNVSAVCAAEESWLAKLTALIARRPDAAARMVVELTETAVVRHLADATRFIARLRDLGIKTAIDDFGAGYTSFRALKDLDVDMVKIDGAFINALGSGDRDEVFVRALVDIAGTFGMNTVAEWVRDAATVEKLRAVGVDYFQGEYFGLASPQLPWADAAVPACRRSS